MDRDKLLLGLAAVFAGLTTLIVVAALAEQPFLLAIAVPFAATTYLLWYHASGRLEARVRARAAADRRARKEARVGAGGPDDGPWGDPGGPTAGVGSRTDGAGSRTDGAGSRTAGGYSRTAGRNPFSNEPTREEAYRTLGLEPGADSETIRRAYRSKVKEVHPDTDSGDEEAFRRVNRAYERLND